MPIVVQEVNSIIAKLKCRKAPGWDNITAEHLKYSGPICRCILTWILNSVHDTENIPVHFRKGVIVPIPKSDKDRCSKENYRGITLLPVFYKIYEHILSDRLNVSQTRSASPATQCNLHRRVVFYHTCVRDV